LPNVRDVKASGLAPGLSTGESLMMSRALFDHPEVGITFSELTGELRANQAFHQMLGYTEIELQGRSWESITHPDDTAEGRQAAEDLVAGRGDSRRMRRRLVRKDGSIVWTDVLTVLIRDGAGAPLRLEAVVIDIDHRVAAEVAAAATTATLEARDTERTAELEASNRELEAFAYSVSHDLRAPLRAIAGFSSLLNARYASALDERGVGYVTRIETGAARMGDMIDDLLRFSRVGRQELRCAWVNPADLARDVLLDLEPALEGREVELEIHDMPTAWADGPLLHHVYLNLLSNAIKFTSKRSHAHISVDAFTAERGGTVYRVADNGAGFDMTYLSKLFGVFQRLHGRDEYEGTGVGLALVSRIIERHGGRIWAEAAVDAGAIFYFTLEADHE